jgi:hypothetical protein
MTMQKSIRCVGLLVAFLLLSAAARREKASRGESNDLVVHEWGTFLSMQGSDGATLEGMYHEEHQLPAFVHSRSRDQLRRRSIRTKGETPVIYFYTTRKQTVDVQVDFPEGMWTQWYPQTRVAPALGEVGSSVSARKGVISWSAEVIPPVKGGTDPELPKPAPGSLWNHARQVDAAFVKTVDARTPRSKVNEYERFLFYRGLGEAPLPLVLSAAGGGTLSWNDSSPARHLFVLRVEGGRGAYTYIPRLSRGETPAGVIPEEARAMPLEELKADLGRKLEERLIESGLYPKEARAMVNTWSTSYFSTEGVRVLYVLPREWTDRFLPIHVTPAPLELVRVMVGRLEALTPKRERAAEEAVRDLASSDGNVRSEAFKALRREGRYAEPVVRRVLETTRDPQVAVLCRRLLSTDYVTELRAALESPKGGPPGLEERTQVRAELARLLREIGLPEEALREAALARKDLAGQPEPPFNGDQARHYLRARALILEGLGDEAGAAAAYGRFVEYAAQVRSRRECTGCHDGGSAPRSIAWFKDWWAGEKFASATRLAGQLERAIAGGEEALSREPANAGLRMKLAYLYREEGLPERSALSWAALEDRPGVAAAGRKAGDR